ncbi:tail protein X [Paraburkholderia sp.]|uniref:tail protein X n=1 Tax=Paraburkholderia sp. TaxID=1926495 RepID=UPI0025DDC759|nr:tail protein X [Paraburkholderia sp.]
MSQVYIARDGDTLDYVAWAQYGAVTPEILNAVLAVNPGLSDLGPLLPLGTAVVLPAINVAAETAIKNEVSLWS